MIQTSWNPPLTRAALDDMANPTFANQPEVIPWQLYDTAAIATAAAGPFVFFQAPNVDKTLSNMEGPGQLPDPQYLIVDYAACDFLIVPVATAQAAEPNGAWADLANLQHTCRMTFEFNMSNKLYGPFSITMTSSTGGPTGQGYGYGTAAAGTSAALVLSGRPGSGGFPFCGSLVIPPKIGFSVTLRLAVAATLVATRNVRFSLVGPLYRRVL